MPVGGSVSKPVERTYKAQVGFTRRHTGGGGSVWVQCLWEFSVVAPITFLHYGQTPTFNYPFP